MNEQELRTFLEQQARAWAEGDAETVAQAFAPDGVFLAPGFVVVGQEAIAAAARDYFKNYHHINAKIRNIWWDRQRAAVEWDWSDTKTATSETLTTREAIMIDFDTNGKVTEWREYFNRLQPTPMLEEVTGS